MPERILNMSLNFKRSSRSEVFRKKDFFKNLTKFTRKHLYLSLLLNKIAGLRP